MRGLAALKRVRTKDSKILALQRVQQDYLSKYLEPDHKFFHSISSQYINECFVSIRNDICGYLTTNSLGLQHDLSGFLPTSTADLHHQLNLLTQEQIMNPNVRPPQVEQTNLPQNAKKPATNKEVAKVLGDISNTRQGNSQQGKTELSDSDRRKSAPARIDPTKQT